MRNLLAVRGPQLAPFVALSVPPQNYCNVTTSDPEARVPGSGVNYMQDVSQGHPQPVSAHTYTFLTHTHTILEAFIRGYLIGNRLSADVGQLGPSKWIGWGNNRDRKREGETKKEERKRERRRTKE